MSRIATPVELPHGYDEWCDGKNGYAHRLYTNGAVRACEKVCEPYADPRYQESLGEREMSSAHEPKAGNGQRRSLRLTPCQAQLLGQIARGEKLWVRGSATRALRTLRTRGFWVWNLNAQRVVTAVGRMALAWAGEKVVMPKGDATEEQEPLKDITGCDV